MPGIGLLGTMEMARNAMQTARQGAEVTGHNLANASNPAYSRQRVKIESAATIDTGKGPQGAGSRVSQFESIRNQLIEDQLVSENSVTGYLEIKQRALQQAEAALGQVIDRHTLNEGGDADQFGIAEGLTDFFSNLSALSASPTDNAERQNMVFSAQKLADKFNTVDRRLSSLRNSLNQEVQDLVDDLNMALNTVSRLSINIGKSEVSEVGKSNELRDQRQSALQDLAKLVNFNTSIGDEGGINVIINDTTFIDDNAIVDGFTAFTDTDSMVRLKSNADPKVITLTSGLLQGAIDARDITIKDLQDNVNNLAKELVTAVNDGYDTGPVPTSGLIAHYPMKGNANEATGNGTNGTVTGATLTTDRAYRAERAYSFDGSSDYITTSTLNVTGSFSVAGWVKISSSASSEANAMFNQGSEEIAINIHKDGKIGFQVGGTDTNLLTSTGQFSADEWVHVVSSWDGTTGKVYINGTKNTESTTGSGSTALHNPSAGTGYIGKAVDVGKWDFNGSIADIRVYDRALTDKEVDQLHEVKAVVGHKDGKALDGTTGQDFFTGTDANNIAVNQTLMDNPSKVQAAGPSTTDEPGDNGVVLGLSRLSDSKLGVLSDMTASENFSYLTSKFGQELSLVNTQTEEQEAVTRLLTRQRDAISGVSIDEEIANLMIYQRAFQASAKLISTMDSLMRDVISLR